MRNLFPTPGSLIDPNLERHFVGSTSVEANGAFSLGLNLQPTIVFPILAYHLKIFALDEDLAVIVELWQDKGEF